MQLSGCPVVRARVAPARRVALCAPRMARVVVRAEAKPPATTGVFKYVADAFASIFGRLDNDSDVPWPSNEFSGKITHGDHAKLNQLYKVVRRTRGCMDPNAVNYDSAASEDDGSCVYETDADGNPVGFEGDLGSYLGYAMSKVIGHNFKGDSTEPKWHVVPFTGQITSQRDIDRMMRFEKTLKSTLDSTTPTEWGGQDK